jgi:hypothetical protein
MMQNMEEIMACISEKYGVHMLIASKIPKIRPMASDDFGFEPGSVLQDLFLL